MTLIVDVTDAVVEAVLRIDHFNESLVTHEKSSSLVEPETTNRVKRAVKKKTAMETGSTLHHLASFGVEVQVLEGLQGRSLRAERSRTFYIRSEKRSTTMVAKKEVTELVFDEKDFHVFFLSIRQGKETATPANPKVLTSLC